MAWFVNVCILVFLGCIVFQDFQHRQISWYFIPLLITGFVFKLVHENKGAATIDLTINICFIILQLLVLTIYMSVKNKKIVNIINSYLGLGDVLFFLVLCAAFSPVNFLVFYVSSIILTLTGYILYNTFIKKSQKEIPLAGAMAVGMMILMITSFIMPEIKLYNDAFFISCFIK